METAVWHSRDGDNTRRAGLIMSETAAQCIKYYKTGSSTKMNTQAVDQGYILGNIYGKMDMEEQAWEKYHNQRWHGNDVDGGSSAAAMVDMMVAVVTATSGDRYISGSSHC